MTAVSVCMAPIDRVLAVDASRRMLAAVSSFSGSHAVTVTPGVLCLFAFWSHSGTSSEGSMFAVSTSEPVVMAGNAAERDELTTRQVVGQGHQVSAVNRK